MCACGKPLGPSAECAACRTKRLIAQAVAGSGHPLEPGLRTSMESKLGHDFSRVRIHDDALAGESARSFGAEAYTVGSHVLLARPASGADRELLTHELVHVVQSSGAPHAAAGPIAPLTSRAEREAERVTGTLLRGGAPSALPRERVGPGTVLPRLQATRGDFHDPNFCYRPGMPRDSTHPDRTKVVAVMQAMIDTPASCDGIVSIQTSVLQSAWGAASAEFEYYGGGTPQGISMGIRRDDNAERVDFEERFTLDTCHAGFDRCHLITFMEGGTKYTFAEARYRPRVSAQSLLGGGTRMIDTTPAPDLIVEPCNNVGRTLCRGS